MLRNLPGSWRRRVARLAHNVLATIVVLLFLLPLLWALSGSLHDSEAGVRREFGWIPSPRRVGQLP